MNSISFGSIDVTENTFAESVSCIAVYNRAPILPGHTLIVPKHKFKSILQMKNDDRNSFFTFADQVTRFLLVTFKCSGFDWTLQDGEAAGQTIPHTHLHIIPRQEGDLPSPGNWYDVFQTQQPEYSELDSADRYALPDTELYKISQDLRVKWQNWQNE